MKNPPSASILFADDDINDLFAELLQSHGVETHIVAEVGQIPSSDKIVTEPQFLHRFDPSMLNRCLVVGNRRNDESTAAVWLSRPLTEKKIEAAFQSLFHPERSEA